MMDLSQDDNLLYFNVILAPVPTTGTHGTFGEAHCVEKCSLESSGVEQDDMSSLVEPLHSALNLTEISWWRQLRDGSERGAKALQCVHGA